jgi:hypothetical protein
VVTFSSIPGAPILLPKLEPEFKVFSAFLPNFLSLTDCGPNFGKKLNCGLEINLGWTPLINTTKCVLICRDVGKALIKIIITGPQLLQRQKLLPLLLLPKSKLLSIGIGFLIPYLF